MGTDGLAALLPLPVAVPLAAAALVPVLARWSTRLATALAVLSLLAATGFLLAVAPTVYRNHLLAHYLGSWGPVNGHVLGVTLVADPWGLSVALATTIIGTLILIFMIAELRALGTGERGWFTSLYLLLCAAITGTALAGDLMNLFVWFEVAALASYPLTAFFLERPPALEAAFKILVLTTIAGFAVFIGVALVYSGHGALNFGQVHLALLGGTGTADLVALGLFIGGFATKAGLMPWHGWLPDAHTVAPGPVSAQFSGLMVNIGIVTIGRLVFDVYAGSDTRVLGLLLTVGLVSALGGALYALLQQDLKRVLAYDTVSQMGVLCVGLSTANPAGLAGTAYHLVNHAMFKSLLFLCAGVVLHATGATELPDMGGIARRMPWLVVAFAVGTLAIAGIPPMNGYVSLGLIHTGLLERHEYLPYGLMLCAQVLTIAALGRCLMAFFRKQRGEFDRDEKPRLGMLAALGILGVGCLVSGGLAGPMLHTLMAPAAAGLLDPGGLAGGATAGGLAGGGLADGGAAAGGWAAGALSGGGPLRPITVHFAYATPADLVGTAATVALAIPLMLLVDRHPASRIAGRLRAVHTGSVNDYASYLTVGLIVTVSVLAAWP